jgi:hypothetical protein
MSWFKRNWKALVKNVAPALATALGSPAAGVAIRALGQELLGKENATEKEVSEYIMKNQSPELLAKIKQTEANLELELAKIDKSLEEIAAEDRASARELAKRRTVWPQVILTALFVLGYFLVLGFVVHYVFGEGSGNLAPEYLSILSLLLGILTSEVPRIMTFWFGSSHGSKEKDLKLKGAE